MNQDELRAQVQAEAAELFTSLMHRSNPELAVMVAAVELGNTDAAIELLRDAGVWEESYRDLHPLVLAHMALGAWEKVLKTWDDPWTYWPRRALYPLRHPLLWLYQHSELVRRRWDRRIRERVQRRDLE